MGRASVLLVVLLAAATAARGELVLVFAVTRHGARNVLPKSAVLSESDATGGPALLPAGRRQSLRAGEAFRLRYLSAATCAADSPATCLAPRAAPQAAGSEASSSNDSSRLEAYGLLGAPGVGFTNYNTLANSSALDRTISSANAFLAGAFGPGAAQQQPGADAASYSSVGLQVPVYMTADSDDWRVRGYSKCPAYQQRLAQFFSSQEFKKMESDTLQLRDEVQQLVPQLNASLANWWNVYDAFNVYRTHGVGTAMPPVDNATYAQVIDLANWLETAKMRPGLTRNALGGGLLGDLLARLDAAQQAVAGGGEAPHYRLLLVSSHYNAQLGVVSALQAAAPAAPRAHVWTHTIPALASVLAFELHASADRSAFAVRAVVQDGPEARYAVLPLPCAAPGSDAGAAEARTLAGPGACSLAAFRSLAGRAALNSSRAWCAACGNTRMAACRVAAMERQLAALGGGAPGEDVAGGAGGGAGPYAGAPRGYASRSMVAVWCAVAVAAATLLAAAGLLAARQLRRRRAARMGLRLDVGGAQQPAGALV